jgi:hypothetical protein
MLALVVALILVLPESGVGGPCDFVLSTEPQTVQIVGSPEVTMRTSIMRQPDSPLAILAVDLSSMQLTAAPGTFSRSGRAAVVVKNVSDRILNAGVVKCLPGSDLTPEAPKPVH